MPNSKNSWKFTEREKSKIIKLWKSGLSTISISKIYSCDDETIRQIIKKRVTEKEYKKIVNKHMKKFNKLRELHQIRKPKLSKHLAWWVGVLKGDGHIHEAKNSRYVKLEVKDKDFRDRWAKIGFQLFKIIPKLKQSIRNPGIYYIAMFNSKLLVSFLKEKFGSFGKYKWDVPKIIKKSSAKVKLGFLSGLFDAEGSFKTNLSLTFVSVNKIAINEVKQLLDESGIESRIRIEKPRNRPNSYGIISITHFRNLSLFAEKVNFTIERKRRTLINYITKMDMSGFNVPAYL